MTISRHFFLVTLVGIMVSEVALAEGSRISLSLMSWGDSLSIISPPGERSELLSSSLGVCPGLSSELLVSSPFSLEAGMCFFLGMSSAGFPSNRLPSGYFYSARNLPLFGINAHAIGWWEVENNRVALGLGVPLLLHGVRWPEPDQGYSLEPESPLGTGMFFSARWQRTKWPGESARSSGSSVLQRSSA